MKYLVNKFGDIVGTADTTARSVTVCDVLTIEGTPANCRDISASGAKRMAEKARSIEDVPHCSHMPQKWLRTIEALPHASHAKQSSKPKFWQGSPIDR